LMIANHRLTPYCCYSGTSIELNSSFHLGVTVASI